MTSVAEGSKLHVAVMSTTGTDKRDVDIQSPSWHDSSPLNFSSTTFPALDLITHLQSAIHSVALTICVTIFPLLWSLLITITVLTPPNSLLHQNVTNFTGTFHKIGRWRFERICPILTNFYDFLWMKCVKITISLIQLKKLATLAFFWVFWLQLSRLRFWAVVIASSARSGSPVFLGHLLMTYSCSKRQKVEVANGHFCRSAA